MAIFLPMRKSFTCILFLLLFQTAGFCQQLPDSSYTDIGPLRDSLFIGNKALLFFDSNNVAGINNILQQQFVPLFRFEYKSFIRQKLVPKYAYLKIALYNSDTGKKIIFLYPGSLFDNFKVYKQTGSTVPEFYQDASKSGFARLMLQPGEKIIYIVSLDFCRHDYNKIYPQLIMDKYFDTYKRIYRSRSEKAKIFGYTTSGMLFIILLFVAANYFLYRKKEFLYYLGYAGFNFLLMLLMALLNNITGSLSSLYYGYVDLVFLILSGIFYLAFIRHFLETKSQYLLLDKSFKKTEIFLLMLLLLFSAVHFFTDWYFVEALLENVMKVILLSIGILFIVIALKQKKKLLTYLAVGNSLAIFFSIISLIAIWVNVDGKSIFATAIFYFNLGIIFFTGIFFCLG